MHIHVFTIDALPTGDIVSTGGGLRSLQIINGLQSAGAKVTWSMPYEAGDVRRQWHKLDPRDRALAFSIGGDANQKGMSAVDILNKVLPDVAVCLWPSVFDFPKSTKKDVVFVYDVNGLQNVESSLMISVHDPSPTLLREQTSRYINKLSCADYLIGGSAAQAAYWSGLYSFARSSYQSPDMTVIPYTPDSLPEEISFHLVDNELTFVVSGSFLPWNSPGDYLRYLVEEIQSLGKGKVVVVGRANPFLPHSQKVNQIIKEFEAFPFFKHFPSLHYAELSSLLNGKCIGFDLHARTLERELALPIRTITYLCHGMPILVNDFCFAAEYVLRHDAGWVVADDEYKIRAKIREILLEPLNVLGAKSERARAVIQKELKPEFGFRKLVNKLEGAVSRKKMNGKALPVQSPSSKAPVVLIVTEDYENFLELRVRIPFEAMYRAGLIDGYHILSRGMVVKSIGQRRDISSIDVVWVQRAPIQSLDAVQSLFGGQYIYDIDDNLLVSPSYRVPFSRDWCKNIESLLLNAACVTTTGPRLVASLQRHSGVQIEHKALIAPNFAEYALPRLFKDRPTVLALASSDSLALTASRDNFFHAVDLFMRDYELPLLYIGNESTSLNEVRGRVTKTGFLNYANYRQLLRSENILAIAPLETRGDVTTSEFVNCKSDIKMVEFGSLGVPAVYADACPYRDSDLEPGALIDCNDSHQVYDALEAAYRMSDAVAARAYDAVSATRLASNFAAKTWGKAILENRLPAPVDLERVTNFVSSAICRFDLGDIPPESMFDEENYLLLHPDVARVVAAGHSTAYEHYVNYGFSEGRQWVQEEAAGNARYGALSRYGELMRSEPSRIASLEAEARILMERSRAAGRTP